MQKQKSRDFRSAFGNCQKRHHLQKGDENWLFTNRDSPTKFALFLATWGTQHSTGFASHQQLDQTSLLPGCRKDLLSGCCQWKKILIGHRCPCLRSALSYSLRRFDLSLDKRLTSYERWNSPVTLPSEILQVQSFRLDSQPVLCSDTCTQIWVCQWWWNSDWQEWWQAEVPENLQKSRAKTSVIIPMSTCVSSVHESRLGPLRSSSAQTVLTQGPDTECLLLRCSHDFKLMKNWLLLWNPSEATVKSDRKKSKAQLATGNKLWQGNKAKYLLLLKRVHWVR